MINDLDLDRNFLYFPIIFGFLLPQNPKNDILYDSLCHLLVTKYVNIIYKKKKKLPVTSNLDLKIKK